MTRGTRQPLLRRLALPRLLGLLATLMLGAPDAVVAQSAGETVIASAQRGPRFLVQSGRSRVPVDLARTPLLRQRITVDLNGVPLRQALAEVSAQSGIRLMYTDDLLPVGAPVRLRAEGITVAAALTDLLVDAEVDVVFTP